METLPTLKQRKPENAGPPPPPPRRGRRTARALFLVLVLAPALALVAQAGKRGKEATIQMRFGVDMAQRGAWKEAQYRFERAAAAAPADAEILNNLAVAYENNGRYDAAESAYLKALESAPDHEKIRANYERFRLHGGVRDAPEADAASSAAAPSGAGDGS